MSSQSASGTSADTAANGYPSMDWPTALDIPLKASEELVSIDLATDLPDDPNDLRTLLVEESSDKEHWLTIAIAYCNQGMLDSGIRLVSIALEIFQGQDQASLHTFLTWAHLKAAKMNAADPEAREQSLQRAETSLKDAITYNPTWIGNILATLDLYYQRGHYDKALETADLFIKGIEAEERRSGKLLRPNCMFLFLRAKLLYHKKNYKASLKTFQELLVINPAIKPDPRIGIGMCFWQLRDCKMAIKAWQRAAQLNPADKNAQILVLLTQFYGALTDSANDAQFKESFTSALKSLDAQLSDDRENPVLLTLLQSYYYLKGDYQRILDLYTSKLESRKALIAPTVLSDATFWCGRAYYALGEYRKAFSMFQESLRNNEDNLLAKFGIGQSQIKTNLIEESILTFENMFKTHESIQELNYILGVLYAGKCLGDNQLSNKDAVSISTKAIQFLERYVNIITAKKNQLVTPRAYLLLSRLYEIGNNYKQSLDFLAKVVDEIKFINEDAIPLEIYNNMGCFYFLSGETDTATKYFEMAKEANSDDSTAVTLDFNVARSQEAIKTEESSEIYSSLLSTHPKYLSARIRELYCKYVASATHNIEEEDAVMKQLLSEHESNLEVRSFYSWFLKNVKGDDALATETDKETLVKYNSHDVYALVSLANLYATIARDSHRDVQKSNQSYLKAIQLYQKVLQIDPLNVFAAQGLAVVFAEQRRMGPALEILRKVRDSIKNEDVLINLANCLLEMKEYAKAIETYDLLVRTFSTLKHKALVLNLLGRAWYFRGMREKEVDFLKKGYACVQESIVAAADEAKTSEKFIAILKYNMVLFVFQICETLRRAAPRDRTKEDLEQAQKDLATAIETLRELSSNSAFTVVSAEELDQRVQLGETTMHTSLERAVEEQTKYEAAEATKLDDARRVLDEQAKEQERVKSEAAERERERAAKQAAEYQRLQDEARKYLEERDALAGEDNELAEDETDKPRKRKRARRASASDSESDRDVVSDHSGDESSASDSDEAVSKRARRGKKVVQSNESDDEGDDLF